MKTFGAFSGATPGSPPPGMYVPIEFPSLGMVNKRTRDGRMIDGETFAPFDLPRSIQLVIASVGHHDGAEPAGRLDEVTVGDDGNISGKGWLNNDPNGQRAAYLIRTQSLRGNSMDLSVAQEDVAINITENDDGSLSFEMDFRNARLAATTLLTTPAFEDSAAIIPEGWDVAGFTEAEIEAVVASLAAPTESMFAFSVVKERPRIDAEPFQNPKLTELTPIFVDEGERVFGHVAGWDTPHLNAGHVVPPRSRTNYAYFASKTVLTTDGFVPTGALVIGGNHAPANASMREAIDHYANTCAAWSDVSVGEDDFGIWVAGIVRPGTSNEQVHAARASALSGDWRNLGGSLEMCASLSVNAPGFPIPRARAFAHEEGLCLSLTGAGSLAQRKLHGNLLALPPDVEANLAYVANAMAKAEANAMLDAWDEAE